MTVEKRGRTGTALWKRASQNIEKAGNLQKEKIEKKSYPQIDIPDAKIYLPIVDNLSEK